jgi:MFS family permease
VRRLLGEVPVAPLRAGRPTDHGGGEEEEQAEKEALRIHLTEKGRELAVPLASAPGTVEVLVLARVVQALGGAMLVPASLALVLPEFPLERRATATALWGATGAVAAAAGCSLGGLLVDWQGWRAVFYVNLLIGLPALLPARRLLRESREPQADLPDALGALLLAGGVGALALGIVEGPDWGWESARVVGALVASALLLCNVLFRTSIWGYSILEAGVALTPGPLAAAIAAPVGGRLSDRFGQRLVAVPGGLVFAAGALLFALGMGEQPSYVGEFLPATLLTGSGVGLSFAAFGRAAVAELPRTRYATGGAISNCFRQIGAALGISTLIVVLGTSSAADAVDDYQRAWALIAGTGALAGLTGIALGRVRARYAGEEMQEASEGARLTSSLATEESSA